MNMSLKESCIILDLVMAAIFFLIGFLFYRSNGKAANFLTGYFPIKGTLIAWVIWSGMFILLLIERHKRER